MSTKISKMWRFAGDFKYICLEINGTVRQQNGAKYGIAEIVNNYRLKLTISVSPKTCMKSALCMSIKVKLYYSACTEVYCIQLNLNSGCFCFCFISFDCVHVDH